MVKVVVTRPRTAQILADHIAAVESGLDSHPSLYKWWELLGLVDMGTNEKGLTQRRLVIFTTA